MANNNQESQNRGHAQRDKEAITWTDEAKERSKEKRDKWLLYIILFVVFQSSVITLFTLTVMRIRTPKLIVHSATFHDFNVVNSTSNPSFNTSMNIMFELKNANFGRFKYGNTKIHFLYRGRDVGKLLVPSSFAKWQSTEKFDKIVGLNFDDVQWDSRLGSDLNFGILPITCQGKIKGTVELLFVMKKNKWSHINCSMEILTATQQLRNIDCR